MLFSFFSLILRFTSVQLPSSSGADDDNTGIEYLARFVISDSSLMSTGREDVSVSCMSSVVACTRGDVGADSKNYQIELLFASLIQSIHTF